MFRNTKKVAQNKKRFYPLVVGFGWFSLSCVRHDPQVDKMPAPSYLGNKWSSPGEDDALSRMEASHYMFPAGLEGSTHHFLKALFPQLQKVAGATVVESDLWPWRPRGYGGWRCRTLWVANKTNVDLLADFLGRAMGRGKNRYAAGPLVFSYPMCGREDDFGREMRKTARAVPHLEFISEAVQEANGVKKRRENNIVFHILYLHRNPIRSLLAGCFHRNFTTSCDNYIDTLRNNLQEMFHQFKLVKNSALIHCFRSGNKTSMASALAAVYPGLFPHPDDWRELVEKSFQPRVVLTKWKTHPRLGLNMTEQDSAKLETLSKEKVEDLHKHWEDVAEPFCRDHETTPPKTIFSHIVEHDIFDGVVLLCYGEKDCAKSSPGGSASLWPANLKEKIHVQNGEEVDRLYPLDSPDSLYPQSFYDKIHASKWSRGRVHGSAHVLKASLSHLHAVKQANDWGWESVLIIEADLIETKVVQHMDPFLKNRLSKALRDVIRGGGTAAPIPWRGIKLSAGYKTLAKNCGPTGSCGMCLGEKNV